MALSYTAQKMAKHHLTVYRPGGAFESPIGTNKVIPRVSTQRTIEYLM